MSDIINGVGLGFSEPSSSGPGPQLQEPIFLLMFLLETSSDGVSRLGLSLETHFCEVSGLETLNIAKKWFIKVSITNDFLFVVFAGKKQSKHVGKMP